MIRAALLYGLLVGLGFGAVSWACYATTGPTPSCAQDPNGSGCYGGLNNDPVTPLARRDGGR